MNLLDKYSCIFCKYRKLNKNHDYACMDSWDKDEFGYPIGKCNSLSNIYYGKLINHFPFKQIDNLLTEKSYKKEEKYNTAMDKKYGNCYLETDDFKFIWGLKSWDDLSSSDANMLTMNNIDIIYDKHKKEYILGIETAFNFKNYEAECEYLKGCLKAFTKYMDNNGLNKNKQYSLFMSNPCTSMVADSIEELYTNFRIFVNGFCTLKSNEECMKKEQ